MKRVNDRLDRSLLQEPIFMTVLIAGNVMGPGFYMKSRKGSLNQEKTIENALHAKSVMERR